MIDDDYDPEQEGDDEDDAPMCPNCRAEMEIRMLESKHDYSLGLSWGRFCHSCSECGYRSASWETLD